MSVVSCKMLFRANLNITVGLKWSVLAAVHNILFPLIAALHTQSWIQSCCKPSTSMNSTWDATGNWVTPKHQCYTVWSCHWRASNPMLLWFFSFNSPSVQGALEFRCFPPHPHRGDHADVVCLRAGMVASLVFGTWVFFSVIVSHLGGLGCFEAPRCHWVPGGLNCTPLGGIAWCSRSVLMSMHGIRCIPSTAGVQFSSTTWVITQGSGLKRMVAKFAVTLPRQQTRYDFSLCATSLPSKQHLISPNISP